MALTKQQLQGMFGGGMLGGAAGGMFGGNSNPANAGMGYLDQLSGMANQFQKPYYDYGVNATGQAADQFNQLTSDPSKRLAEIGAGYKQSPGFKFAMEQALKGAGNAAGAAGMTGSPQASQQSMQTANDIASQDYGNYMQQALGMYNTGLQGQMGLSEQGQKAGESMANLIAQQMAQQAQAAQAGQASKNQSSPWGNIGSIAGMAGSFLPFGNIAKGIFGMMGGK